MADRTRPTIWIDLENTPHVPFFLPIIQDLRAAGCAVILTARDFAQTKALVEAANLDVKFIGKEQGDRALRKTLGILLRSIRLAAYISGKHVDLAVGHGSRGLLLASKLLRIPSLTLYDYEGASVSLFNRLSTWIMTPSVLGAIGIEASKHLMYHGLKEDVYVGGYEPAKIDLDIDRAKIIVTVRPPSHTAHYKSDQSFALFEGIMNILASRDDVQVILLPRTQSQRKELQAQFTQHPNIILPAKALPGLDLLSASDLVIGGGGTVNREAAALGVPVATIFKGPMGAVDKWLIESGRMAQIDRAEEIIPLLKKREQALAKRQSNVRQEIVSTILRLAGAAQLTSSSSSAGTVA